MHTIWFSLLLLATLIGYRSGFYQGDLDRRLKDAEIMSAEVESEMLRHYKEENYWQDKAEDCLAKSSPKRGKP